VRCDAPARYGEILGRAPAQSTPRLWVHAEGHFQVLKFEEWGEVWEEWKWTRGGAGAEAGSGGAAGSGRESVAMWILKALEDSRCPKFITDGIHKGISKGKVDGTKGVVGGGGQGGEATVGAKWTVTSRDLLPPRPNLHMKVNPKP